MLGLSHFWFCQQHPFLKRSMTRCPDTLALIIEWLDWFTLSKHGKGKQLQTSLESDGITECDYLSKVLVRENQEFQKNLVEEVSHAYLNFFYYILRFIGANFIVL